MRGGSTNLALPVFFAALADRTRLRLLNLMVGREVCVCHFVAILAQSQPKISRHLAYLRKAGLVTARREGKWMHYSVRAPADPSVASLLASVLRLLSSDEHMLADQARLARVCCVPQDLVVLDEARSPVA